MELLVEASLQVANLEAGQAAAATEFRLNLLRLKTSQLAEELRFQQAQVEARSHVAASVEQVPLC